MTTPPPPCPPCSGHCQQGDACPARAPALEREHPWVLVAYVAVVVLVLWLSHRYPLGWATP